MGWKEGGGAGGTGPNRDLFCIVSTKAVEKSLLLHHFNNIEHNLRQNICTDMEVISPIPP